MNAASIYTVSVRARSKVFTVLLRGSFHSFGSGSVMVPPARLDGTEWVSVGRGVFIGQGCWLRADPECGEAREGAALVIGDGVSLAGNVVLSAVSSLVIEPEVLMARGVYVADHGHAFDRAGVPVQHQGTTNVRPVRIERGAWLAQNVVVMPGVTIGAGAVIGANSVVNRDVPPRTVAVGAPARVIRSIDEGGHDGQG
jgi:acetyltransferase-like isoleucine patch superfamily enzyme